MAETDAKPKLGFLGQKAGPFPLWVWMAGGIGVWYFFFRKSSSSTSSATGAANQQTDPAGNIGSIDPATGYVYGTPEDTAALAANNAGTGSSSDTGSGSSGSSTGGASGAQSYSDNESWGRAAVNYLVGIGVDPTQANQAVTLYLSSQPLNTQQQALINQSIQAIGAPPTLPGPTATNPGQVVTPPGSGGGGGNPPPKPPGPPPKPLVPQKLHISQNNGTSAQVSWDLPGGTTSGAGGKQVTWLVQNHLGSSSGPMVDSFTTGNTIANLGGALAKPAGLKRGTKYTVRIRENVANASWASLSYTTNQK